MNTISKRTCLAALCGLLLLSAPLAGQTQQKMLTVADVVSPRYYRYYPVSLQWLPDGQRFSYLKSDSASGAYQLWIHDAASGQEELAVSAAALTYEEADGSSRKISLRSYQWRPAGSGASAQPGIVIVDRGDIWLFTPSNQKLLRLTSTPETEEEVEISPDGQQLAFVRDNDLYVINLSSGREKRLTRDGSETHLNGKLDWVYQEELVERGEFGGYRWSPNSDQIAYLHFDETAVPQYPLIDWQPSHPTLEQMRYPKAGDPNPEVTLRVVSIESGQTVWLDTGKERDIYLPRFYWLPEGRAVAFMRLDRHQQNLEFLFADAATGKSRVVLHESDPYWINIGNFVYFLKERRQFIWGSERSGYNHLYLYDYSGTLLKPLTSGNYLVSSLDGVDETSGKVYFTGTRKSVLERHLYQTNLDGAEAQILTAAEGTHRIKMAPGAKFYLDYFSDLESFAGITLHDAGGRQKEVFRPAQPTAQGFATVKPELLTFQGDNGLTYHASIIRPLQFDPARKYPVLIFTYGGPHGQEVQNHSHPGGSLWHQMLAQKGYIIFTMDNRGAAGRGHVWESPIHLQMGKIELEDQLRGVAYLKSLPYVDEKRIGIWGWSYGGYMTLYALTHSDVFCAGISVAPVTDWRNYDTIYTERYMGLPEENEEGYKESSPVNSAGRLSGKLLLVHGTADDNVHMQNSIQMVDALIAAGKQFQLMFYPRQKHGIGAPADRLHLYQMMTDFLDRNLMGAGAAEHTAIMGSNHAEHPAGGNR